MHVDYIGFGRPKFEGDIEFFNEIFDYVNDKNFIDINSKPLSDSGPYSFTFEFYFKDQENSFTLSGGEGGSGGKKEGGEEKKEGGGEDYEENNAMKQGKIPKFSRKESIFVDLCPRYTRYCSFYLNFDELKNIPGDFEKKRYKNIFKFLSTTN